MKRVRIHYSKNEHLRYTSTLDIHKVWERTLRRAHLPIAYSKGYNKKPRINQACPLPLGFTSQAEIIDIWLEQDLPADHIYHSLKEAAPEGLEIRKAEEVKLKSPSLQSCVTAAEYQAEIVEQKPGTTLDDLVANLLSQKTLQRTRRSKEYDLRPLIERLEVIGPAEEGKPCLFMRLSARSNSTGRPDEVLFALGLDPFSSRLERVALILND